MIGFSGVIRLAETADCEEVLRLQESSPEAAQWSREAVVQACIGSMSATKCLLAVSERVVGFILLRRMADEMEILNLIVSPKARRLGVGAALLTAAIHDAQEMPVATVFLEVRESNQAAQSFYERAGFEVFGRRTGYYANPVEDALILKGSPLTIRTE